MDSSTQEKGAVVHFESEASLGDRAISDRLQRCTKKTCLENQEKKKN